MRRVAAQPPGHMVVVVDECPRLPQRGDIRPPEIRDLLSIFGGPLTRDVQQVIAHENPGQIRGVGTGQSRGPYGRVDDGHFAEGAGALRSARYLERSSPAR